MSNRNSKRKPSVVTEMTTVGKPPLGIVPKRLWEEDRARELARTIKRHLEVGYFTEEVIKWVRELDDLLHQIAR